MRIALCLSLLAVAAIGCVQEAEQGQSVAPAPGQSEAAQPEPAPAAEPQEASGAMSAAEAEPESAAADTVAYAMDIDPYCGMRLEGLETVIAAEYDGKTYGFCCEHCRTAFLEEPEKRLEIVRKRLERAEEAATAEE